jgi:hypothetical protein
MSHQPSFAELYNTDSSPKARKFKPIDDANIKQIASRINELIKEVDTLLSNSLKGINLPSYDLVPTYYSNDIQDTIFNDVEVTIGAAVCMLSTHGFASEDIFKQTQQDLLTILQPPNEPLSERNAQKLARISNRTYQQDSTVASEKEGNHIEASALVPDKNTSLWLNKYIAREFDFDEGRIDFRRVDHLPSRLNPQYHHDDEMLVLNLSKYYHQFKNASKAEPKDA